MNIQRYTMYSRNYGRGDISAKITPPPSYGGSAIQGAGTDTSQNEREESAVSPAFAPFPQSIPLPQSQMEECPVPCPSEERREEPRKEEACPPKKREKNSFLSGFLDGIEAEDLILIGIVAALIFDLADRDILLVALVIAAVLM